MSTKETLAALELILKSDGFRKAPSLRHLIQYLVTKSLEGHPEQIKESIIAIDVFGRREDFDGRTDNIVRVQAHRLRKQLETYYGVEGRGDPVRITVPKGSYVPQFDLREGSAAAEVPAVEIAAIHHAPEMETIPVAIPVPERRKLPIGLAAAFLCGAVAMAAVFLLGSSAWLERGKTIAPGVREIWAPFFETRVRAVAAYSNPAFLRVGNSPMLLLYNGPVSAPPGAVIELGPNDPNVDGRLIPKGEPLHFSESWTGTGEVLAVNRLTMLSNDFRHPLSVTPSRLLSLNEMHGANVIFVGSPSVNGALAQIGGQATPFSLAQKGLITIRDPRNGEPHTLANVVNQSTGEVTAAYAVFSVLPGIDAGTIVVTSAGLSTVGTWAGIDYTTSTAGASELVRSLKAANGGVFPQHYQAIVRANIIKGAASNPSLVAVRVVKAPQER